LSLFSDLDIAQGSVATHLMCGWILNNIFIANSPMNLTVNSVR